MDQTIYQETAQQMAKNVKIVVVKVTLQAFAEDLKDSTLENNATPGPKEDIKEQKQAKLPLF